MTMVRMGCHDRLALFVPGCRLPPHFIKKAGCAVWGSAPNKAGHRGGPVEHLSLVKYPVK